MRPAASRSRTRRFLATEVVQTSTMDCGPAALKSLLDSYRVPVSYGRLREACQTGVDGTSIDSVEVVANQLGLAAEQVMLPIDHVFLERDAPLPAIVVVRQVDTATHFVVVWRRHGAWVQVMDPAVGRRWMRADRLCDDVFRHAMRVPAVAWRAWAASHEFVGALRQRMQAVGIPVDDAAAWIDDALADAGWFPIGALDASVRLVHALVAADGIDRGADATAMTGSLYRRTRGCADDIHAFVPATYWSATPDATNTDAASERLVMHGAVLVRIDGLRDAAQRIEAPAELAVALNEKPVDPLAAAWRLLREDGVMAPRALMGAIAVATAAVVLEALLFRGIFDLTSALGLASQRLGAVSGLVAFLVVLLAIEMPVVFEAMRQGRHLEARLRMALLAKLPRLDDRYFQSRPISDMAERGHSIHLARNLPSLAMRGLQAVLEVVLTLAGIVFVAPDCAGFAVALAAVAIALPVAVQPMLGERELRVRNHVGALGGFYLDALLGLVPIRAHRAERNVRQHHESLLVEWTASLRGWIRMAIAFDGTQALLCTGLAAGLLARHFFATGTVDGPDLLLVFWTLKLPAVGARLAGFALGYPAQRNALLRLLEPIGAPEAAGDVDAVSTVDRAHAPAATIAIRGGRVLVAGHEVLHDVDLDIAAGEHVAIVGVSGAGKSSLLGLLLGWHRLSSGTLAVDGCEIDGAMLDRIRRDTAWVDPGIQLWNRSFLENLQFASDADGLERVADVMQAARVRGLLEKLPQGLQTFLGEGGALLSGGEGQRVRLARALMMRRPRLALLDEPFRGLDRTQRRALLAESRRWWRDATLLCVTHDLEETLDFDRVLVVEDGTIVEDGAPRMLAGRASRYAALLAAERDVRSALWDDDGWRCITMRDGRIERDMPAAVCRKAA